MQPKEIELFFNFVKHMVFSVVFKVNVIICITARQVKFQVCNPELEYAQ